MHSFLEWQCDKVDWSSKITDFSTLIGYHGNVPWEIEKNAQWGEQALAPIVYQSRNFGKHWSGSISVWETGVRKSTIRPKKVKKKQGKIALQASLPSGLKYLGFCSTGNIRRGTADHNSEPHVKNGGRSLIVQHLIMMQAIMNTATTICTSLNFDFYLRFRWPMLLNV